MYYSINKKTKLTWLTVFMGGSVLVGKEEVEAVDRGSKTLVLVTLGAQSRELVTQGALPNKDTKKASPSCRKVSWGSRGGSRQRGTRNGFLSMETVVRRTGLVAETVSVLVTELCKILEGDVVVITGLVEMTGPELIVLNGFHALGWLVRNGSDIKSI